MKLKAKFDNAAFKSILDKIKDIQEPVDSRIAKNVANSVVEEMKKEISVGKSTIAGRGKFEAYRGEYKKRIQRYGAVSSGGAKYSKKLKPVNLKVSGNFLESLKGSTEKSKNGYAAVISINGVKNIKIEQGHRDGANGQAERPIIPINKERFVTSIQKVYLRLINEAIARISKRK